jgi:hypothetical protein
MPRAGKASANRAYAHYRWAQRYAKAGKLNHAIPHFGRALHYDELAFGGQDDDDDDRVPDVPPAVMIRDITQFALFYYKGATKEAISQIATEIVSTVKPGLSLRAYEAYKKNLFGELATRMRLAEVERGNDVPCDYPRCERLAVEYVQMPGDPSPMALCLNHAEVARDHIERAGR